MTIRNFTAKELGLAYSAVSFPFFPEAEPAVTEQTTDLAHPKSEADTATLPVTKTRQPAPGNNSGR